MDQLMDEEIKRLELEQAEFDALCLENTQANSAIVSSPVSVEDSELKQEPKQEPVYGSLATERPISKSEQVYMHTLIMWFSLFV
jgi:hypothetical protein